MKRQRSVALAVLALATVLAMAGCGTQGAANQAAGPAGLVYLANRTLSRVEAWR